jgi:hypothetical protein
LLYAEIAKEHTLGRTVASNNPVYNMTIVWVRFCRCMRVTSQPVATPKVHAIRIRIADAGIR